MPRTLLPLLLVALAGCPKADALDGSVTTMQLADSPRLPAPHSGSYARVPKAPKDPVVRAVVGERTWDESLAGAAAGLALGATQNTGGFTRREIREASWQAGYPWPVLSMGTWPTSEGGVPPEGVLRWVKEQPASRDLGLVRARGQGQDLWVGLSGEALVDLGIVAREVASGTSLSLPAKQGATWRISDGNGAYQDGSLAEGHEITFDVPGEWLIQIVDPGGDLARFPVYVDEEAPTTPVLPPHNINVDSRDAAVDRVHALVQRARDEYRNKQFFLDPLLDAAARDMRTKGIDPDKVAAGLAGDKGASVGAHCRAGSVEDCIDRILWSARSRQAFVDGQSWSAGFEVAWAPSGVEVWALFVRN